ncbi:MAG: glycosyltransferase [Spirochaetes bacterium]|nr:glycosyltransferase [Spirochaetota bacterium]
MNIAVHVTHEAVQKIGGIGAVISGLCTADRYKDFFNGTLLYGPLFDRNANVTARLGKDGEVYYSSIDNFDSDNYHSKFHKIEEDYDIDIVYGKRLLVNEFNVNKKNTVDTILVSINRINEDKLNRFKFELWQKYGVESDRYSSWDYEQYVRIAPAYPDILKALYPDGCRFYHFAHEYMGVPAGLSVLINGLKKEYNRTIFYAHEISPCRGVVEESPGHDISFYPAMYESIRRGRNFEDDYGSQADNYRAELVRSTVNFDYVFAVSDLVKDEYRYFIPHADENKIKVVYNGIPVKLINPDEKLKSRKLLQDYVENLYNYTPDIIFTHVTRLVISKGIWRDITLLYILDEIFHRYGVKGAFILLTTLVGTGRDSASIAAMEEEYGWPVVHREGWPDLVGYEKDIYDYLSLFNARSKNIKAVFLNQFGFDRRSCGRRVPETASFRDLRVGSDAEFGFSIYEPFGIAQLEVIPFGGIAALSSSCGSSFLLKNTLSGSKSAHYSIVDFIGRAKEFSGSGTASAAGTGIDSDERFKIEKSILKSIAGTLFNSLPKDDSERIAGLKSAQECVDKLGWEAIVDQMDLSTL